MTQSVGCDLGGFSFGVENIMLSDRFCKEPVKIFLCDNSIFQDIVEKVIGVQCLLTCILPDRLLLLPNQFIERTFNHPVHRESVFRIIRDMERRFLPVWNADSKQAYIRITEAFKIHGQDFRDSVGDETEQKIC